MDKACQECWESHEERKNILFEALIQIQLTDSLKNHYFTQNNATQDTLNITRADNTILQKKVRRNRKMAIGGFGGFLGIIILLFTIK